MLMNETEASYIVTNIRVLKNISNDCCFHNFFNYWREERQLNAYDKNASLIGAFDFTS
jgi:hypothetical protein